MPESASHPSPDCARRIFELSAVYPLAARATKHVVRSFLVLARDAEAAEREARQANRLDANVFVKVAHETPLPESGPMMLAALSFSTCSQGALQALKGDSQGADTGSRGPALTDRPLGAGQREMLQRLELMPDLAATPPATTARTKQLLESLWQRCLVDRIGPNHFVINEHGRAALAAPSQRAQEPARMAEASA